MKKTIKKALINISEKLPTEWTKVGYEQKEISHEDILLSGLDLDPEDGKVYKINVPVWHRVCHISRVKKAFERGGIKEVKKYIDERSFGSI